MKAEIFDNNGIKCIKIDGRLYSFAATRSFRPEGRILKDFSDHGIKFFNIFPSGIMTALNNRTIPYSAFGPVWIGEDEYNWDNLRAQCNEFFNNIGDDAYVSISVHLDPPQWYVDLHPELVDHWEQMIQNLGSEEWKKSAAKYLCAIVDKMDEWYPNRIYAIFLMCGGTTEWYSYHADEVIEKPTELQQKTFRNYTNNNYESIPSVDVLHHAEDGFIRHPVNDKPAIDYWKYTNDITTDTILYFAHIAKEHTKRTKLVGLFTNQSYGTQVDWVVRMGHNNSRRILNSKDIDMLFCPASYIMRKLESTSGIRTPVDSFALHNKLFVHEIDSSTYLLKKKKDTGAVLHAVGRDEPFTCTSDSKMYIRREVALSIAKGEGYWWFDMFSGYYDDPEMMNEITKLHQLQDSLIKKGSKQISEVIELMDEESNYMLKTASYYPMLEHQTEAFNKAAAPWAMANTFDLFHKDFDLNRFKLFVFPLLFYPSIELKEKISELRKIGKSILFMHAPGYVTDNGYSIEAMHELTGIQLEKIQLNDNTVVGINNLKGIDFDFNNSCTTADVWHAPHPTENIKPIFTAKDLDIILGVFKENGYPAVGIKYRKNGGVDIFSACSPLPAEYISEIYNYAGIFKYSDHLEPIYTNSEFECAYSYEGGMRKLYRKEDTAFTDFFTNEKIVIGPTGTEIHFQPHETKMLIRD